MLEEDDSVVTLIPSPTASKELRRGSLTNTGRFRTLEFEEKIHIRVEIRDTFNIDT